MKGLIHRWPRGFSQGETSAVSASQTIAEGTDPGSFGWTNGSTGVEDTDYTFTTSSGRSRIRDITDGGRALLTSNGVENLSASQNEVFLIVDRITATNNGGAATLGATIALRCNNASDGNLSSFFITHLGGETNWDVRYNAAYNDTGKSVATERRLFMYADEDALAVWWDADPLPSNVSSTFNTTPAESGTDFMVQLTAGLASAGVANINLDFGAVAWGDMTAS